MALEWRIFRFQLCRFRFEAWAGLKLKVRVLRCILLVIVSVVLSNLRGVSDFRRFGRRVLSSAWSRVCLHPPKIVGLIPVFLDGMEHSREGEPLRDCFLPVLPS